MKSLLNHTEFPPRTHECAVIKHNSNHLPGFRFTL